jgi:hypothetical protein
MGNEAMVFKTLSISTKDYDAMHNHIEKTNSALWHIHSLADLLVVKYQEMIDAKQIIEGHGYSSPLLSIAEILNEKAEAALDCMNKIEAIHNDMSITTV